jgi:polysaccharide export outer membrane protein
MLRNQQSLTIVLLCLFFFSCKTQKKTIYFQDSAQIQGTNNANFEPKIKISDLLSITVLGIEPDAVRPFNIPNLGSAAVGGYTQGAPSSPGYVVYTEGNIDFPVIGKIKVAGFNRSEVISLIKSKLELYIQNPTVLLKIVNYKITVIGDVKNPGTFTIPNERVTIFEAIGIAGDLLITGKRNNVKVIRDTDGVKKEFIVDLTSAKVFDSQVYYLQQNDLIYVEPNRSKVNSSLINSSNVGLILSGISVLLTIFVLVNN